MTNKSVRLNSQVLFLFFLFIKVVTSYAKTKVIGAIDLGSGKLRYQVAEVDTKNQNILKVLDSGSYFLPAGSRLAKNPQGVLPHCHYRHAEKILQQLKMQTKHLKVSQWKAMATEAYRKAQNGKSLLQGLSRQFKIPFELISQEKEAHLGLMTVVHETSLPPERIVVWDTGGGSFQITSLVKNHPSKKAQLHVTKAPLGRVTTLELLLSQIRGDLFDDQINPYPIYPDELQQLTESIQAKVKSQIQKMVHNDPLLTGKSLIAIGSFPEMLSGHHTHQIEEIEEQLKSFSHNGITEFPVKHNLYAMTDYALLYSIMKEIQKEQIHYFKTLSGNTTAILLDWP